MTAIRLSRTAFGQLHAEIDGVDHSPVVPVRAFPIAAPDRDVALLGVDGKELAWIADPAVLDAGSRTLLTEELERRAFMPVLQRLVDVSTFSTPSVWSVETDRGPSRFVLRSEESIRRIGDGSLLIADANGIQYLVRRLDELDRNSRRLFDRFL